MLESGRIHLKSDHANVEQGGRDQLVLEHAGLGDVQTARTGEDDGRALGVLDGNLRLLFLVEVAQLSAQCGEDILDAERQVGPEVGVRILQVEHDSGRAGVQHLHHQFGIVGGASHLVALVGAPGGQLDAPIAGARNGLGQVSGQFSAVRCRQHFVALPQECLLARSELAVQRQKKLHEARGQIAGGVEIRRRGVHRPGLHGLWGSGAAGVAGLDVEGHNLFSCSDLEN